MKKVTNYLGLRKVAINLQLDKLPADVDQYIAELAAELEEELRQIDRALLILRDEVKERKKLNDFKEFLRSKYHLPVSNKMMNEFEREQSS